MAATPAAARPTHSPGSGSTPGPGRHARRRGTRLAGATLAATAVVTGLAAPAALTPSAQAALAFQVTGTGGVGVNARSAPTGASELVGHLPEGAPVSVSCQLTGQSVAGTTVWDFVPALAGFVTDAYVFTGYTGRHPGLPDCATPAAVRGRIVATAARELAKGVVEGPALNQNPYGPSVEWCSLFATWVWRRAGVAVPAYAFTGDLHRWGAERGLARPGPAVIRPGDAVLFGTGPGTPQTSLHVGLVEQVLPDGRITTIDGNKLRDGAYRVARVGPMSRTDTNPAHEPGEIYAVVSPVKD